MAARDFGVMVRSMWDLQRFLCIGLDPDTPKIPASVDGASTAERMLAFNRALVDATKDIVCAYKPNPAFYEAQGAEGWRALKETIEYIHTEASDVPVILDAKRGDIGNTNAAYARMAFESLGADAITVQPYQGGEALKPFLDRADKGIIVLCRTSNPGAGEFQDLEVDGEPLFMRIAKHAAYEWNGNGNCALVVGAPYPDDLVAVRAAVGDMLFLIPGIGAQGGEMAATVSAGKDANNRGVIINASRAVIYASTGADFAQAARVEAVALDSAIRAILVE